MAKVSAAFNKTLGRKASAVEEARKAENTMMTCKMPVGWKGQCVCVDAVADKAKDKKDDKGNTVEGNDYVRLEFSVINDEQFQGSKFSVLWMFYNTANATWEDRFTWCLNGLENLGLPRTLRENYEDFSEILEHFTKCDEVFDAEVVHNAYRQGDQKEVKVRRAALIVDASDSMVPEEKPKASSGPRVGGTVLYMGKDWKVLEINGDDIQIQSLTSNAVRAVKMSQIEA